jgi:hypothetical protein
MSSCIRCQFFLRFYILTETIFDFNSKKEACGLISSYTMKIAAKDCEVFIIQPQSHREAIRLSIFWPDGLFISVEIFKKFI